MVTWYLLVTIGSGAPQRNVYSDEQQACQAYLAVKANSPAYIYQITGRRDSPVISDGECKPVQQFVVQPK